MDGWFPPPPVGFKSINSQMSINWSSFLPQWRPAQAMDVTQPCGGRSIKF